MHTPPYLTDAEIAAICEPLVAPSAQIRYLRRIGIRVSAKPNRRPLVARAEFERAMSGQAGGGGVVTASALAEAPATADVVELRQRWAARGKRNGAAAEGR